MFAINETAILLPEEIEVKILGTVGGQALVQHETMGTMQVPFRRLKKTSESGQTISEVVKATEELAVTCEEVAEVLEPPDPQTLTTTGDAPMQDDNQPTNLEETRVIPFPIKRPSLEEQPDAPMVAPKTSLDVGGPNSPPVTVDGHFDNCPVDLSGSDTAPSPVVETSESEATLEIVMVGGLQLPQRMSKKWLAARSMQELSTILDSGVLGAPRQKKVQKEIDSRAPDILS